MRSKRVVPFVVGVFIMGCASVAMAQQAESQLTLWSDVHINPGKVAEFEAASKDTTARMGKANVTFLRRVSVSEGLAYRFSTPFENMAALDTRRAQFDAMPPASDPSLEREAIHHIHTWIVRTRPDLIYAPDNPRVPLAEAGFIHEVRLCIRFGTQGEAGGILKKIGVLASSHNLLDAPLVYSQVADTGTDGPFLGLYFVARDAADYYAQSQKNAAMMGQDYQALA